MRLDVLQGGARPMTFELEIDELSFEDGLVHMMVADMFSVEVILEDGYLIARGRERDIWAWLYFHIMAACEDMG